MSVPKNAILHVSNILRFIKIISLFDKKHTFLKHFSAALVFLAFLPILLEQLDAEFQKANSWLCREFLATVWDVSTLRAHVYNHRILQIFQRIY